MQDFTPTHTIVIRRNSGIEERIEVQAGDPDAETADATVELYTREEWDADAKADWTYSPEDGLRFQGEIGPYTDAEYQFRRLAD